MVLQAVTSCDIVLELLAAVAEIDSTEIPPAMVAIVQLAGRLPVRYFCLFHHVIIDEVCITALLLTTSFVALSRHHRQLDPDSG